MSEKEGGACVDASSKSSLDGAFGMAAFFLAAYVPAAQSVGTFE